MSIVYLIVGVVVSALLTLCAFGDCAARTLVDGYKRECGKEDE